jgi:hypothetical protein
VRSAGSRPSRRAATSACQRLGHVEVAHVAGQDVARALLRQQPAVEQHPDRLDRVERDAFGASEDAARDLVRQPRDEALERRADRVLGQRGEGDVGAPCWTRAGDLRPREDEHEDRQVGRPLDEVVDEVEQPAVGPLDVLEDHDHRPGRGNALEEQPPSREQVRAVGGGALLEPEQVREARLEEPALALVGHIALDGVAQLGARARAVLVLGDPRAGADHLGQRPIADALAVGQTAALVPAELLLEAVDVLVVLPQQPRLARAGVADDGHQARRAARDALLPRRDDVAHLGVAAHERRLEAGAAPRSADAGDDAQRRPRAHRLLAPLDVVRPGVLVGDGGLGGAPGHVVDEDRAGRGDALQARGGVHGVPEDHALALGGQVDGRRAGQDSGSHAQCRHADLLAERGDRLRQRQGRADRSLRVVLARHRCAPHGHHRIADELLDDPAVLLDQRATAVEVARQDVANLLGIPVFGERREADEVREQHRDQAPLGGHGDSRTGRSPVAERRAAAPAETVGWLVRGSATRAGHREGVAALAAEAPVRTVLRAARRALHQAPSPAIDPNISGPSMRRKCAQRVNRG